MRFLKSRNVKSPERGTGLSAGIDFFVPYYDDKFLNDIIEKNNPIVLEINTDDKNAQYIDTVREINFCPSFYNILDAFKDNNVYDEYNCAIIKLLDGNNKVKDLQIFLPPNGDIMIPSGIHTLFDRPNQALAALNKSGRATRDKLIRGAELIDADYQGEIHCHLFNAGRSFSIINTGSKAIQFVLYDINLDIPEEIGSKEFYELHNTRSGERGSGGFGSTGIK